MAERSTVTRCSRALSLAGSPTSVTLINIAHNALGFPGPSGPSEDFVGWFAG